MGWRRGQNDAKAAWMHGNGSLWEKAVSELGTTERTGPVQFAF
jgi:hypothetical protein